MSLSVKENKESLRAYGGRWREGEQEEVGKSLQSKTTEEQTNASFYSKEMTEEEEEEEAGIRGVCLTRIGGSLLSLAVVGTQRYFSVLFSAFFQEYYLKM